MENLHRPAGEDADQGGFAMTSGERPRGLRQIDDPVDASPDHRHAVPESLPSPAHRDEPNVFYEAPPGPRHAAGSKRHIPMTRTDLSRRHEYLVLSAAVTAYCLTAVFTINHASSVYLPPDGAHYLGEADNYLGTGVLDFTHPPAFPLLVAGARVVVGPLSGVLAAMVMGLALTYVSVYALLRQWLRVVPSLFGVSVGMLMPINAELVGWAGGAELLGLAFGVLTLACFEWWIRRGGRRGFAVGIAFGLTVLSHPFGALVAAACLGVRWIVEFSQKRHLDSGWEPTGLKGLCSAVAAAIPLGIFAINYYTKVQSPVATTLGLPAPAVLGQLLSWSSRENRVLLIISVAALGTAFIASNRGAISISAALAAVIILTPTLLQADTSYQARAIYYMPVLIAIGGGYAWNLIARWSKRWTDVPRWYVLGGVLLVVIPVAIGTVGFAPRIQVAVPFYGRLQPDDVRLLDTLHGQPGAVATSWSGGNVAEGASMSWYVSGLARRYAYGPSGPWLEDQPVELQSGRDMQRAFSGVVGIDDTALQLSAQPAPSGTGSIVAGPYRPETDIQASVPGVYGGFMFPLLILNTNGDQYPFSVQPQLASADISNGNLAWSYPSLSGGRGVQETLTLHGRQVAVDFRAASSSAGPWKIYLRPAAGQQWSNLDISKRSISVDETIGGRIVSTTIQSATPKTQFQYLPVDPITGAQALAIDTSSAELRFTLEMAGSAQPAPRATSFDQSVILSHYNVSEVVVFKSSGVQDLFDSACFSQGAESSSLVVFHFHARTCPLIHKLSAGTS
jgi:hypothetical protein